MKKILRESFQQNPNALEKLLATGNATLTHTQDKTKWGTEFPKLLMEVRNELRTTQPPTAPVSEVKTTDQFKYFGAMYTIKLDNGVGVDVEGYRGKPVAKFKLLNAYNENPDVDPQNGRKFREDVNDTISLNDKKEDQSILNMRTNMIDYTSKQKKALLEIESIIDSDKQSFYLLSGYAGTGKTTIAENIAKYAQFKDKNVKIIAPTNKAAKVLRDKLKEANVNNVSATTIHKLIYSKAEEDEDGKLVWSARKKVNNTVIIVDESSMISKSLMKDLLDFTESNNFVIFMGDSFQLEQVGEDSGLFKGTIPQVKNKTELTEVKRQSLNSNILKIATLVRTDNIPYVPKQSYDDFKVTTNRAEFINNYKDSIINNEDAVMIVATNKERILINKIARDVKFGDKIKVINEDDTLISVANSNSYPNSETFKIIDIINVSNTMNFTMEGFNGKIDSYDVNFVQALTSEGNEVTMILIPELDKPALYHSQIAQNMSGKVREYLIQNYLTTMRNGELIVSSDLVVATYGYAITAHKSQGSQWSKVYVNQNFVAPSWNGSRWYYTAITRAADSVEVYSSGNNTEISVEDINNKIDTIINETTTNRITDINAPEGLPGIPRTSTDCQ